MMGSDGVQTGGAFFGSEKRNLVLCLALVVCTLAAYSAVRWNGFVGYDDDLFLTANPHVQAGLRWSTVRWAFTSFVAANWQPLTLLAHALDYQLFKLEPAGHHYVSVLLHCLNVVLLFRILVDATQRTWASLAASAIFALHPLHVESVAWAAELRNVLSMFFLLLALQAYQRYARHPSLTGYAVVTGWFACGLMTKPQVITLPFLLLLWDCWPLRRMEFGTQPPNSDPNRIPVRPFTRLLVEKIPLLALSVASAVLTVAAQRSGGAVRSTSQFPLAVRVENAFFACLAYVEKLFWPVHLAALYPHPGATLPVTQIALGVLFVVVISAWVVVEYQRSPQTRYLAVGWFWFLGSLVPMIGLIQVGEQGMADRYMYLPMVGLLLVLCWGVADWAGGRKACVAPLVALVVAVLVGLGVLTYRQVRFWHDDETLWVHAVAVTRNNYVARLNLGADLIDRGQIEEAAVQFRTATQIRPTDPAAQLNLATCERRRGNCAGALQADEAVLRLASDKTAHTVSLINLGSDYLCLGDAQRASESYGAALRLNPNAVSALVGLGRAAQRIGEFDEAARNYSRAVELAPSDVTYLLLSDALRQNGQVTAAQGALNKARALSRDFAAAQQAVRNLQLR